MKPLIASPGLCLGPDNAQQGQCAPVLCRSITLVLGDNEKPLQQPSSSCNLPRFTLGRHSLPTGNAKPTFGPMTVSLMVKADTAVRKSDISEQISLGKVSVQFAHSHILYAR